MGNESALIGYTTQRIVNRYAPQTEVVCSINSFLWIVNLENHCKSVGNNLDVVVHGGG